MRTTRSAFLVGSCVMVSIVLQACASGGVSGDFTRIRFAQDVVVSKSDGSGQVPIKAGGEIQLDGGSVLIESPGHIGMALIPVKSTGREIQINLKQTDAWSGEAVDRKVDARLNELASGITEIQVLLAHSESSRALEKLDVLQAKNPGAKWLQFLRASCWVVAGDFSRAQAALEAALKDFPTDPAAKALYEAIRSRKGS